MLQPGDEFLILACDGIWDVLTNQEVGGCTEPHSASTPLSCILSRSESFPVCVRNTCSEHRHMRRLWISCGIGLQPARRLARCARRCATAAWHQTQAAAARAAIT